MKARISYWVVWVTACGLLLGCTKEDTSLEATLITFDGSVGPADLLLFQRNEALPGSLAYGAVLNDVRLSSSTAAFGWGTATQPGPDTSFTTQFTANKAYTFVLYDSAVRRKWYIAPLVLQGQGLAERPGIRFFNCVLPDQNLAIVNDTNRVIHPSSGLGDFPDPANPEPFIPTFSSNGKLKLIQVATGRVLDSIDRFRLDSNRFYSIYASGVVGATGDRRPKLVIYSH